MSPRHTWPARRRSARHARPRRNHRLRRALGLGLVAVLLTVATGAATAYTRLQGNIASADVDHLLGPRPPETTPDPDDPNAGTPVNILVMGSDTRENNDFATDDVAGQRADTTIVVHLSGDRERVEMVSIPRDSLVDIPECRRSDGSVSAPRSSAMFNEAFATGGSNGSVTDAAACTMTTVEQNTGVRIHHFVVVDMGGFVNMVDALGGVPMCIPHPMRSKKAHLDLEAGFQTLDGRTALALARARTGEGLGDGSDTGRIERQQELLAATAREALGKNLLTDLTELYRFVSAATSSLTVSSGIAAIPDMVGLAYSLRGVSGDSISFMTIPFRAAPDRPGRVVWTEAADEVWAKLAADEPLVEPEPEPEKTQEPGTDDGSEDDGTDGSPSAPRTPAQETEKPSADERRDAGEPVTVEDLTGTTVCS